MKKEMIFGAVIILAAILLSVVIIKRPAMYGADPYNLYKVIQSIAGDSSRAALDTARLDMVDSIATPKLIYKLTPVATPPADPEEGWIYADTDHHIYMYNGTAWVQVDN